MLSELHPPPRTMARLPQSMRLARIKVHKSREAQASLRQSLNRVKVLYTRTQKIIQLSMDKGALKFSIDCILNRESTSRGLASAQSLSYIQNVGGTAPYSSFYAQLARMQTFPYILSLPTSVGYPAQVCASNLVAAFSAAKATLGGGQLATAPLVQTTGRRNLLELQASQGSAANSNGDAAMTSTSPYQTAWSSTTRGGLAQLGIESAPIINNASNLILSRANEVDSRRDRERRTVRGTTSHNAVAEHCRGSSPSFAYDSDSDGSSKQADSETEDWESYDDVLRKSTSLIDSDDSCCSSSGSLPCSPTLSASAESLSSNIKNRKSFKKKSRTAFSSSQLAELEKRFNEQKYLTKVDRCLLAQSLGLTEKHIKTWYQNRRTKWKKDCSDQDWSKQREQAATAMYKQYLKLKSVKEVC